MQTKKILITVFLFAMSSVRGLGQSLDKSDSQFFFRIIDTFLSKRDVEIKDRKTELTILMMKVDSSGKIDAIHMLSDEKRRGNTYSMLSMLNPEIFHRKKFEKCAGKFIILPVITVSLKTAALGYPNSLLLNAFSACEGKGVVWAKTIHYLMPGNSDESHVERAEGYLDTTKYKKRNPIKAERF